MQARTFRSQTVLGIGEAMVEFAPVEGGLYRRGFAGDTLNTCWHMAALLGDRARVGYATRVGRDALSDQLVAFLVQSGIDIAHVGRDTRRTIGLYVIDLVSGERSFSYWRESSAARLLADDPAAIAAAITDAGLVHVSGITLAVIGDAGRGTLIDALRVARAAGAVVSFDPNVRMRLWRDAAEARAAIAAMLMVTDIALPSFDDEAALWGDPSPEVVLDRFERAGVGEVVVKNGASDAVFVANGARGRSPASPVAVVRDTTGAGDAFNAGYLAARLVGSAAVTACDFAQRLASAKIAHPGALAPREALAPFQAALAAPAR